MKNYLKNNLIVILITTTNTPVYCTILYCTILYYTVLYCTQLDQGVRKPRDRVRVRDSGIRDIRAGLDVDYSLPNIVHSFPPHWFKTLYIIGLTHCIQHTRKA